jgi:hypothetical protein
VSAGPFALSMVVLMVHRGKLQMFCWEMGFGGDIVMLKTLLGA